MADQPEGKPADDADVRASATLVTSEAAAEPSAEAPGTMQLPRGAAPNGAPAEPPAEAAPLLATMVPNTAAPMPTVAPPGMPADWRYELRVEIARGGMGRVVEANDSVLGRTVALKEVLSLDADTVRRFQREIRITARLEHPAIVPVHDAGMSPSGAPFYVMRKIGGRALEDLVARSPELNDRLALVPHVVTAAQAIAHAHTRGIVHRDIKPSNILVGELGETIVIDWGLAKAIGEDDDEHGPIQRVLEPDEEDPDLKTRAGIVFGTPGFMAPEQLRGAPVDERCDVYALGATLYHLLARRPPHHHKRPDVMMRAAVDGPPIPLAELVEGVPPELATIVDKALAHDAAKRYQNAGALAEDLQHFLTGQLVASHHYTPRERLMRFARKHRAAVAIGAGSTVALVLGATIAFQQIRGERDRADEQARIAVAEKRIAEQRSEEITRKARELTLTNGRHQSLTDPTRAAAMVKPLVASELWRQARDVAAAARANGIAFSVPVSKHTLSLELSRDGQHALAAGDDGVVRIIDLEKHASREIANAGGAMLARFADAERKVVLYQGNRISVIDAATSDARDITTPTAISSLEVSGPLAYWTDPAGAVWKLDLAGGAPVEVPMPEPIKLVMPSPDGRWIAFGGARHLLLTDRSRPTLPPEVITDGITAELQWSADSKRLAVQIDDEVIDVNTVPAPQIFDRFLIRAHYGLAYSNGKIYGSGPTGVRLLSRADGRVRLPDPGHTLGVHEGRDHVVISAKPQGELVVLSEYGDHTLKAPLPIERVATSARGPWIVAAAEDMLLVWTLEGFEPRAFDSYPPATARFVGGNHLIVTYVDDSAEWIDLRTRKVTPLGMLPPLSTVVASPDGAEAIAIDTTRHAWRVAGVGQPEELDGEIALASFVDNTQLVLASARGIQLEDLMKKARRSLFAHEAAVADLATQGADGGWVAASFEDGVVWRTNLTRATTQELPAPTPVPAHMPVALTADGTVIAGGDNELRAWRTDGGAEVLVKGLEPIVDIALVDDTRAIVTTSIGTGYVVDLRGKTVVATMPVSPLASLAPDSGLIAGPTGIGGVEVLDPIAGWRWPLAVPQKGVQQPFVYVEIARDGTRVLGQTQYAVAVWPLDLPRTAEDTASWLDKLTNATADNPSGPLSWR